jgi:hypothetical protein
MAEEPVGSTATRSAGGMSDTVTTDRQEAPVQGAMAGQDRLTRWHGVTRRHVPRWTQTLIAVLIYAAVAIQLTWPVATDLDGVIFGGYGDLTGGMANLREMVDGHHNPFGPGRLEDFSAPEGRPVEWTQNAASFASTAVLYGLAVPFGAVAAYSLFTLAGFIASGAAMFLLARRLTGSFAVSLLIGWAFAFYPFAVMKAGGHVHFVHGWPLVLILWRMLALYESPSLRNGVLAGLATVIAIAWSPYFLLIGGVAYAALLAFGIAVPMVRRRLTASHLKAHLTSAAIVGVFASLLAVMSVVSARGTGTLEYGLDALNAYSARPHEYLVPPADNPIFGEHTGPWLERHLHGSNFSESTLYVGWSMILLSLLALVWAARRRLSPGMGHVVAAASLMGVVALLFSAPPKVTAFGQVFPFPSLFTFELSGAWRVYTRFVMVVMLALCVLAAIGLHRLLRGRTMAVQAAILIAVATIVVLDLRIRPVGTNELGVPPIYETLERLPAGMVAEYPIEPSGFGDYSGEFYQDLHGKPVINGYTHGSLSESRALGLAKLDSPLTPGRLSMLGVRYVVLTRLRVDPGIQDPGTPGAGLRLIRRGPYHALYSVEAAPVPLVTIGPGFGVPEQTPEGPLQWLGSDQGKIELRAPCSPCVGTLEVVAKSLARPRAITLRDPDGRTLSVRRVGTRARRVSFRVRFSRRALITVTTSPQREAVGGPDPRSLSVSMVRPRLRLRSPGS